MHQRSSGAPHRRSYNVPGHAHELTFSCYHAYPLLANDRARRWFCEALNRASRDLDFAVYAYVLMPEHVHVVVHPRQPTYEMAAVLSAIKRPVARAALQYLEWQSPEWITRLSRKRGRRIERHFWQSGGGYDRNIDEPNTLLRMIDYVHHNPVRRGLVDAARDWFWSSAADYLGREKGPVRIEKPHL